MEAAFRDNGDFIAGHTLTRSCHHASTGRKPNRWGGISHPAHRVVWAPFACRSVMVRLLPARREPRSNSSSTIIANRHRTTILCRAMPQPPTPTRCRASCRGHAHRAKGAFMLRQVRARPLPTALPPRSGTMVAASVHGMYCTPAGAVRDCFTAF